MDGHDPTEHDIPGEYTGEKETGAELIDTKADENVAPPDGEKNDDIVPVKFI